MRNVGVYCLNHGLTLMTRINADFNPFQMYVLPRQRRDMSIEYAEPKFFRSSGAACDP